MIQWFTIVYLFNSTGVSENKQRTDELMFYLNWIFINVECVNGIERLLLFVFIIIIGFVSLENI